MLRQQGHLLDPVAGRMHCAPLPRADGATGHHRAGGAVAEPLHRRQAGQKRVGDRSIASAQGQADWRNADAAAKIKENAAQRAAGRKAIVDDNRRSGITTVRGTADELRERGIKVPRGDVWHPIAIKVTCALLGPWCRFGRGVRVAVQYVATGRRLPEAQRYDPV
jgi:hypothetical protein